MANSGRTTVLKSLTCTGDADLRKLDSSVKRNTALIKRLRQLSGDAAGTILEDIARTNQSKVAAMLL